METIELLKALSEASGPAGYEGAVSRQIETLWQPFVDDLRVDAMGNLIARQQGTGPAPRRSLMAAAHMDEIGLIITGFEGEFLRCHQLGGIDRRVLLGLQVWVHGRHRLPGVIGSRPPHILPAAQRQSIPPWQELFIDVGLDADDLRDQVRVGDHVTLRQPLLALKNGRAAGKALDNRASITALTLALEALQHREHSWDFYAVATVQEEVGIKGAITSAYSLAPDLAIALDVTFAKQNGDGESGAFELGKGPTIGVGPNFHPQMVERMKEAATAEEIPFVIEPLPGSSGTDAWGIQLSREGIPSGLISIPVRYMHQPVETVAIRDVERAGRLLASFAAGLTPEFSIRWEDEA